MSSQLDKSTVFISRFQHDFKHSILQVAQQYSKFCACYSSIRQQKKIKRNQQRDIVKNRETKGNLKYVHEWSIKA